jgi:Spy/CpxP family protein refolding chaperone
MVIFGTGVVTGGLVVHHVGHIRSVRPLHGGNAGRQARPLSPGGLRLDLLRHMQQELNLTPAQRERIDKIIRQGQEHTREITEPVRPQLEAEVEKVMQAFRDVLTPEQQARFDQLLKQQQHSRESRRSQPPREHPAQSAPARTNS